MDYRNERDALRGRVEGLEQQLAEAKKDGRPRRSPGRRVLLLVLAIFALPAIGVSVVAAMKRRATERASAPTATATVESPSPAQIVCEQATECCRSYYASDAWKDSHTPEFCASWIKGTACESSVVPGDACQKWGACEAEKCDITRRTEANCKDRLAYFRGQGASCGTDPAAPPAPLTLELRVGGKGDGPGLFDDPREVAPERDGSFWVADYASGRVQRFDRNGKYLSLIKIESARGSATIFDIAASDTTLFVVNGGELLRFSTVDGKKLGALPPPPKPGAEYRHVFVDAANNLYALSAETDDRLGAISLFDRDGKLVGRWPRKASGKESYVNAHDRIAVDGAATMFIVHNRGCFVEALDPKGVLLNRIGQEGNGPGELRTLQMGSIDVDGHRHLLVQNGVNISVFDAGAASVATCRCRAGSGLSERSGWEPTDGSTQPPTSTGSSFIG